MKNKILKSLCAVLSVYLLSTTLTFANAQCLSNNDDLSIVEDSNLYSIQNFNIELFQLIFPKDPMKNFIFSPYSVWNSLVLAYFGSAGETQKQFEKVLRVTDKVSTLRKWRQLEYMYLRREDTSVNNTFVLSNRAYFDESVRVRTCMQDILHNEIRQLELIRDARAYFDESVRVRTCMQDILHNEIRQLELIRDPTTSSGIINKFVSEKTRGQITELVNPMDVANAYLVLVNAAYFKGNWKHTFETNYTIKMPFKTFDEKQTDISMMIQSGQFRLGYDKKNKYDILEMPYAGDSISMLIFLPQYETVENFQSMVNSFTPETINRNMKDMYETKIMIYVPKFSIDTVVEDDLLQAIYKMGLTDAFISNKANFTDFSFNRKLKLDRSIHKAFIQVNEEGTEAAAATGFITTKIGGDSAFVCNRPFVFMIRDSKTKNILFVGALQSPPTDKSSVQPSTYSSNDQDKRTRKPSEILPTKEVQGSYRPSSRPPVWEQIPPRRDNTLKDVVNQEVNKGPVDYIPNQSTNYSPREPFLPGVKGSSKTKNVFKPDDFKSLIEQNTPQPPKFFPREPFIPSIIENTKVNNRYPIERAPIPTTQISYQPPQYSGGGRDSPVINDNFRPSIIENTYANNRYTLERAPIPTTQISYQPLQSSGGGRDSPVINDNFRPSIIENTKVNKRYPIERAPIPITDIPYQPPRSSGGGRDSPEVNDNFRSRTSVPLEGRLSNQGSDESLVRRFFTYFPFRRNLSDEKKDA